MIWTHGEEELQKFFKYLNSIHEKIKFTHENSQEHINFLDTTVRVDIDRSLYTTLYEKPTDTHLYLHYNSAHHKPCHTKGPYGQFLRIRRICTKNNDFIHHGLKLMEYYQNRGYPLKTLKKHMLRAAKFTQDELLTVKTKNITDTPVMITTYNPSNPDIKKFIGKNWNIIEHSNDCANTFPSTPIIGFRKLPTCELSDIIYLITCKKCNKYYVGETSRPFRKRMYEHRLSVSQPRENRITPVSKHFTEKGHSVKDMQFSVLEWCSLKYHKPDSNHRKMREKWWMWNIGAIHPIGINQFI